MDVPGLVFAFDRVRVHEQRLCGLPVPGWQPHSVVILRLGEKPPIRNFQVIDAGIIVGHAIKVAAAYSGILIFDTDPTSERNPNPTHILDGRALLLDGFCILHGEGFPHPFFTRRTAVDMMPRWNARILLAPSDSISARTLAFTPDSSDAITITTDTRPQFQARSKNF